MLADHDGTCAHTQMFEVLTMKLHERLHCVKLKFAHVLQTYFKNCNPLWAWVHSCTQDRQGVWRWQYIISTLAAQG